MTIRTSTAADITEIVKLVNSAYRGEGGEVGWTNEAHLIGGPRTRETDVAELMLEGGVMLTGWEAEKLAACVYLKKEGDRLYLGMLSVRPAEQGKGVGKQFMEAAAAYARQKGCTAIRITVISARHELIAWYERHGFRRTGDVEPFHAGEKFGKQKQPLELVWLELHLPPASSGYAPINGIRMYYEIHGTGGMPLVLVHGGGSTIETSFSNLIPLLSSGRSILAVELQAHGRTTDRDAPESFRQDADDVAGLLQYLGVGKADLLGFSNGGSTVMQIAVRHPELVHKIVAISGAYRRDGFIEGFFDGFAGATLDAMPAVLQEAFLKVTPDKERLQRMFERDVERMKAFTDWSDEEVRSIQSPALVISSGWDVVTPEHSARIARLIPGSQLLILPGYHGATIGASEAGVGKGYADIVARLVAEFL